MSNVTKIRSGEIADEIGVLRFSDAMRSKLAKKRQEGYGGWNIPVKCSESRLWEMLSTHLSKGDMVDIANFAMMIWNRKNPEGRER